MLTKFRYLEFPAKVLVVFLAGQAIWFWLFSVGIIFCLNELQVPVEYAPRLAILIYPILLGVIVRYGLNGCFVTNHLFVGMAAMYGCLVMVLLNHHALGVFWACVLQVSYGSAVAFYVLRSES